MKLVPIILDFPFMISFEYLGPSLGWHVYINGVARIRFYQKEGEWIAGFHRLPKWITMTELCLLKEAFEQGLRKLAEERQIDAGGSAKKV